MKPGEAVWPACTGSQDRYRPRNRPRLDFNLE
ncbi:hypothetical protein GobsT_41910 [Gemmata obscuriglobus]|nr:hypothetical protein GobsT_41910 [Gemmata obscuriglobus]VTS08463.1 unnamed protein product [Gemmata obscuriglobus UQM 2246]